MSATLQGQSSALATHLERCLAGEADLDALLDSPEQYAEAIGPCFHGLQHFRADADIRAKDQRYRLMQEREMKRLIELLRSGASEERIARISFLRDSEQRQPFT